jgi:4-hydroxymandelate oxidase
MDRREVLKASLAGAASIGMSTKRAFSADLEAGAQAATTAASGGQAAQPPLVSLSDYEAAAQKKMSFPGWEYYSMGTADEVTLRRNRSAFEHLQLKPRMLVDYTHVDTSLTLLGFKLDHPIMLAPAASHMLADPEGEVATARGAGLAKTIFVTSTVSNRSIDDICKAATMPIWFQLYADDDRGRCRALIERAQNAGSKILVVTIDNGVSYARNRAERAPMPKLPYPNLDYQGSGGAYAGSRKHLNWDDVAWIQSFCKLPIVLKGVLTPELADQAIRQGVSGIVVSNHGGRGVDTVPASIEVLPAIADCVDGRVPILLDSGIRRGTDILKSLAHGASAVLIGRPMLYGLAVEGADGVKNVVNILRTELGAAMGLAGCTRLADINRSILWKARDYSA